MKRNTNDCNLMREEKSMYREGDVRTKSFRFRPKCACCLAISIDVLTTLISTKNRGDCLDLCDRQRIAFMRAIERQTRIRIPSIFDTTENMEGAR